MERIQYSETELLIWDGYVQAAIASLADCTESRLKLIREATSIADDFMMERSLRIQKNETEK